MWTLYDYNNRKRDKRCSWKTACRIQLNVRLFVDGLKDVTMEIKLEKSRILYGRKKRDLTEKIENFKSQKFVSLLTNFFSNNWKRFRLVLSM